MFIETTSKPQHSLKHRLTLRLRLNNRPIDTQIKCIFYKRRISGFRIPGTGFQITCQWNLDCGFQSLGLRIPRAKILRFAVLITLHGANERTLNIECFLNTSLSLLDPDYLAITDDGPAGMTNVKKPGGTLSRAIGDGKTDDSSAIEAIINQKAGSTINKVFFPPGEYLVDSNIIIRHSVELHGTKLGIAVIKAPRNRSMKIYIDATSVKSVALNNLYLDGVLVEFNGRQKTNDVKLFNCLFFSVFSRLSPKPANPQLKMKELSNADVNRCIFLKDSEAFGVATQFTRTSNVTVHYNVFGLDLSKINWLSTELKPAKHWQDQTEKLRFLKTRYNLTSDQGFFKSCLYDECDKEMKIRKNVFNGSPNTGARKKDHVVYLKGFNGMIFEQNYARGWSADPTGGIKARNGKSITIACNYIDDTGILLYSHKKTKDCLHDGLKDVVVYGNHIIQRSNPGHRCSGISYYEPHFTGRDENITYLGNTFEIINRSDPTNYRCIWLTNGDVTHHHVYEDNVYYNTTTKVKLEARKGTPRYEKENIAFGTAVRNTYNFPPYKLNIPTY